MCVPTTPYALAMAAAAGIALPQHDHMMHADPHVVQQTAALVEMACVDGQAGPYPCHNIDLLAFMPLSEVNCGSTNDIWGWTDPLNGTEYALLGCNNGVAFVDLSDPTDPVYVGKLPAHSNNSSWRDVAVSRDHAFVISEASNHGLQVFDLTQLRNVVNPPETFAETAHLGNFGQAHTVAAPEDSDYVYVVGSSQQPAPGCAGGGIHVVDIQDPTNPQTAGCFTGDGYTHETECLTYNGPDQDYVGHQLCFASNEDTLTIVDVTDPSDPQMLARQGYVGAAYTHQSWLTEDHRYLVLDDEFDEMFDDHNTRTYIWDLEDIDAPVLIGHHDGDTTSIDHNQYVKGNFLYQSNYTAGLHILNVSQIAEAELSEVAYFDTYPSNDNREFSGSWGNYPFFGSGIVIASGISEGLFVLQPNIENVDPSISIADRPEKEGNVGLRLMRFTLTMTSPSDELVTVNYATADGTAEAGVDYHAASGTVTFEPGEVSAGIFVAIIPNTQVDGNRNFLVNLSDPSGANIEDGVAVGTIFDDDVEASREAFSTKGTE